MAEVLTPLLTSADEKRQAIRDKVIDGLQTAFPIKSRSKILELDNLRMDEKMFSSADQKKAILRGDTLFETIKGTIRMRDPQGKVIDEVKNFTIARVPWFTPRHTLIVGGNEYSVSNQVRPKPGVYTRKRANGILEASFNTRGGLNFNVSMDPEKGIPRLEYKTTKIPLYPILRKAGVPHDYIAKTWGKRLADENAKQLLPKTDKTVDQLYKKVVPTYYQDSQASSDVKIQEIFKRYAASQIDPNVTVRTLGKPYSSVTPDSLLDASGKILKIFQNTSETDDRDNLDYKALYSVDDFFKEVVGLNAREIARKTAIKMEGTPSLRKALPAGPFTPGFLRFINNSQLVAVPTQTNPVELIDSSMRVTALGEGGIASERAIPMEAREVHPTQIGALDPFRTPESFRIGVDVRGAMAVKKDKDNNIYIPLKDAKTDKTTYVRAGEMQTSVVAFPNQKLRGTVDALVDGELRKVPAPKVRYQLPHASLMYSPTTNLVPFIESLQGNRTTMGSKMQTQAVSLIDREAPYIQVMSPTGESFEKHMATLINPTAQAAGTIHKIDDDFIYIKPDKEKYGAAKEPLIRVPYEKDFPLAAKTYINHDLDVQVGDKVTKGQQLAQSNFTRKGTLALGKNLRVAYMPYYGANSNDAVVISEGASKKLTSERMYKIIMPRDPDLIFDKTKHQVYYGQNYQKQDYEPLDSEGVIRPGTAILPGNPVILGLRKAQMSSDDLLLGRLHKSLARPFRENTQTWDHEFPGTVVDVVKTPKRVALTIKTKEPMVIGDKLSGRFGNKGVVSQIIPDDQMIQDESGKPIDVILTSAGVVSRTNPGQLIETAVGKVVEKTGKPILVENLSGRDNVQWAKDLLRKHKIKDKETVYDPVSNKKIPNVFVGRQYILKLMKSTDTNYSARGLGNYDVNQQPTKGGVQSAKALGKMELDALVAHNARNFLREASTLKSQKNDEYWRAVQLGYPTPPPKTTFAYDKFLNMLTAAGVRVNRDSSRYSLSPLTDVDVMELSSGEIKDAKLIRAKDLYPEKGGLFDPSATGGLTGKKWSHINLAEPIVNPIFREPVRRFLGLTSSQLNTELETHGGEYVKQQLNKIDLKRRERELLEKMKNQKGDSLQNGVKQIKYIKALRAQDLQPGDAYTISKIPVLPPVYRPILPGRGGQEIIYGDINPLYRDLLYINTQFKDIKKAKLLPGEERKLRPVLNQAVGAVYGTDEPVTAKSKARKHKGFLTYIAGTTSPKEGYFHSKLMRKTQDMAGRGTVVPDNTLGMDEVGIPTDMLWSMYDKLLISNLVRKGHSALDAEKFVKERHPVAQTEMQKELQERPVFINRAPTLHRYNVVAAFPKMVAGKTIRVNPFVERAQNLDYDGDTMQVHVPLGAKAVEEARGLTLSNLLYSDKSKNDLLVFPQHEAIMGLAHASAVDDKNAPVKFKTEADAMQAYRSGRINLGTRVKIG